MESLPPFSIEGLQTRPCSRQRCARSGHFLTCIPLRLAFLSATFVNHPGLQLIFSSGWGFIFSGLDVAAHHATLFKILLMVFFGLPEDSGRDDLGCDGFAIRACCTELGNLCA